MSAAPLLELDNLSTHYVSAQGTRTVRAVDEVSLRLNAGETLSGHTWTVTRDMTGSAVPKVLKRWKTDPRYAPKEKFFSAGYAMKLELGASKDGVTPGKIFLALPDTEQSVVAGAFRIGEHPMDTAER